MLLNMLAFKIFQIGNFFTPRKKNKKTNLIFLNICSKDNEMYLNIEVTLKNV